MELKNIASLRDSISAGNKFYFFAGKLVISAGLIIFLFNKINMDDLTYAVKNADMSLIFVVVLLMLVNIFLQYIKWKAAAGKILGNLEKKEIFHSLFYGLAGGAYTPARLGEYWGRSIAIKSKTLVEVTVATFLDKIFPLGMVLLSGVCGAFWYYHITGIYSLYLPVIITLLITIGSIFLITKKSVLVKAFLLLYKIPVIKKNEEVFKTLSNLDKAFALKMAIISFFFIFCYILQFAILTAAFSHNMYIGKYLLAGIMVMFSKTLLGPISLSEFGIREGASVYFLSVLGESPETGFNASLLLFIINVVFPSVFGLITMIAGKNVK